MIQRTISCLAALALALFSLSSPAADQELRVLVHNSFSLPKPLLAQLEAQEAGVLEPYSGPAAPRSAALTLGNGVVAVDYGFVTLNYDRASFAKSGLPLPKTLDELAQPAYRDLLVVQNPATSSLGHAFFPERWLPGPPTGLAVGRRWL